MLTAHRAHSLTSRNHSGFGCTSLGLGLSLDFALSSSMGPAKSGGQAADDEEPGGHAAAGEESGGHAAADENAAAGEDEEAAADEGAAADEEAAADEDAAAA